MATKKITQLDAITEADDDDVFVIVDVSEGETGETKKITKGNLLAGTGHTVEMSLNTTTYVLTLLLKNEAGTALSTQTIDLPIEDALTNISYSNGILTLTKQSGGTSTVDISGIISGLQQEITSTNKLESDLVDDTNQTNKFVTSEEKTTWNNKQNALTFDNTPTTNSTNPVTSGGIKTYVDGIVGDIESILEELDIRRWY